MQKESMHHKIRIQKKNNIISYINIHTYVHIQLHIGGAGFENSILQVYLQFCFYLTIFKSCLVLKVVPIDRIFSTEKQFVNVINSNYN